MGFGGDPGPRPPRVTDAALREAEPSLRSLARRLCRNDQDARDLVQDTFERALRWDGDGEGSPRNPRAWLASILNNLFIDRCRALARRPAVESLGERALESAAEPDLEPEPAWSRLTIEDIRAALEEIEPEFRRVYEMHVFDRCSYEQIAAVLRIERVTVGTRLTRARRRLRTVLHRRAGGAPP